MKHPSYYLLHNFQYKVIALFLGALIWYFVQGEQILEINGKIRVKLIAPEGFLIKGSATRFKDVTISGARNLLGTFSKQPIIDAFINVPPDQLGLLKYRVDKEYIPSWDARIKLTIYDAYLDIEIDEKITRSVPVLENIQGLPQEGYLLEKSTLSPKKILITGLKSQVMELKHILTNTIDVSNLNQSKVFEIGLNTLGLDSVTLSPKEVSVKLQIGEKKINKRFMNIPVEVEQEYVTKIRPSFVSIVIQGNPAVINSAAFTDFKAFLDVRSLRPGKYEKEIQVKIPKDTVLIETLPEKAFIEVTSRTSKKD